MKTYSIRFYDKNSENDVKKYCFLNNIELREHHNGFSDYSWFNGELSKKDVKIIKNFNVSLLRKTIFNKNKIDFFIDDKEKTKY